MDFTIPYTEEQQRFRQEVSTWIDQNVPTNMRMPTDPRDLTEEHERYWKEKRKVLAAKGWLYPAFPKQYGGGGLTVDHATILTEEFTRARINMNFFSNSWALDALLVWGTEEQKQRFLVPLLKAEKTTWYKYTEPQSGADLAGIQTRAVKDGDDWLITGQNVFISGFRGATRPDYVFGPVITDPNAPRHRNLGVFIIPVNTPGFEIRAQNLLVGDEQHFLFFDNARVSGDHLIGGEHQGWQVAMTAAENEHGGQGSPAPRDELVENLVNYARDTRHNGGSVGKDPVLQQTVMEAQLEAHVQGILLKRTNWMYHQHVEVQHEGATSNVRGRESGLRNVVRVRDVMGLYAMLGTQDPLAPHGGAQEVRQRSAAGQAHAGGSTNIMKVILARRIGISRTQERAAVTPATAARAQS
jgi:hypothetical protein